MTAKRQHAPAPKAFKGEPVGPVATGLSDLNEVGVPVTDSEFTRRQFWFLRQVAVDRPHKLAVDVALVYADHANRKTGLTYPSQSTVARILGVQPRSVRSCIKALVMGNTSSSIAGSGRRIRPRASKPTG